MKKQLIMLACMLVASITAFAGTNSKILLQHEGTVKLFNTDQLDKALTDAVKGDTIFLPEGTFGGFTLTKEVMVRGCGTSTIISGEVQIAVPDNPTFSMPLLDALKIDNTLTVTQSCKKLHIRKCWITSYIKFNAKSEDVLIDRCSNNNSNTRYLSLSSNIISMTVMNSNLYYLYDVGVAANAVTFINCNISHRKSSINLQTFINCIFGYGGYYLNNCTLLNCLYNTNSNSNSLVDSSCTLQSCYGVENGHNPLTDMATSTLLAEGYLGNDGTIVGIYGGNTPYVSGLDPSAPKVTDSTVKLDLDKKKLNVSLKVTAE